MPLTNTQYDAIMRRYDEIREMHRHELDEMTREIYTKIPEIHLLQDQVAEVSVQTVRRQIAGDLSAAREYKEKMHFLKERKKQLLLAHGYPEDALEMHYDCPVCQDTGLVNGERCSCFTRMVTQLLYESSELPSILEEENFSHFSFDWYSDTIMDDSLGMTERDLAENTVSYARAFVQRIRQGTDNLYIYGKTGVGKTFLAHCIAKEAIDDSLSVIFKSSSQLFQVMTNARFHPESEDMSFERLVMDCDLLIIDDLGTEFVTGPILAEFFQVLNERLIRKKSTVISTNLSLSDLSNRFGERVTSRILDRYKVKKLAASDIRIARHLKGDNHE